MFWASHALIWLNFTVCSILFFVAIFNCKPVRKSWNPWIEGSCMDFGTIGAFTSAFNSVSDLLILILPQPLIWRLQTTLKKKIALSAVFLIGIWWVEDAFFTLYGIAHVDHSACVSSAIRLYYAVEISRTKDLTYYYSLVNLYSFIELTSGISAACLPYSPIFYKSLKASDLWSGLRSWSHFLTQSKTKSTPAGTRIKETTPARSRDRLSSLNVLFKRHNILPYEIDSATISMTDGKQRNTHANDSGTSQDLESMGAIHTALTEETGSAPTMPKPSNWCSHPSTRQNFGHLLAQLEWVMRRARGNLSLVCLWRMTQRRTKGIDFRR